MDLNVLKKIGFTKVEIDIYLILVEQGELSASDIAKKVNISRTYVYDALDHLIKKGVISYVLKNNRKRFKPLDLSKLLEFIDNKKEFFERQKKDVQELISKLQNKKTKEIEVPIVEVLEGEEGLKTVLNDIIRTGKDAIGWGATDRIKDFVPDFFIERYLKERDRKGINVKQLHVKGEKFLRSKRSEFKPLPKEFSSPVTFGKYGNKIIIFFWSDTPVAIRIDNKDIAKSFQNHFNILWKSTKKL